MEDLQEMVRPLNEVLKEVPKQGSKSYRDAAAQAKDARSEAQSPSRMETQKVSSTGQRVRKRQYQHPAELPRNVPLAQKQSAARQQYESRILPAEPTPPSTPAGIKEKVPGTFNEEEPEDFYRVPLKPRRRAQEDVSSHDGRESAQSRRTSTQSGTERTHKRQLSQAEIDRYNRLAQPKYVTPKKVPAEKNSRPRTEREMLKAARQQRAMEAQKGVELPFNDQWSSSKVERTEDMENIRVPTEVYLERLEKQQEQLERQNAQNTQQANSYGALTSFTSLLGWDNSYYERRQYAMESEINSLRKRLWHSQKKNDELNHGLAELSKTNDGLQADLRKVQQKTFSQMSKSAWTPLEDRAIQDILEEVHHDLEEWADTNCLETFAEVKARLNETQEAQIFELCKEVADVTQGDLAAQFKWWEDRGLEPILLLTAISTYRMYSCIFSNEFLGLGAVDEGSMGMMLDVYKKLTELDFKQAHVWRSQLMRIIVGTPSSSGRFDGVSSKLDVSSFIKSHCDDLLDQVAKSPEAMFLSSELSMDSRESLLSCWTRAAELFVQLQTQVAHLQWTSTKIIRSTVNPRFAESHRSQAFPKGRNDGKPISLVISPMVTFFGNEDGERYGEWRAVCKGTILVIDEEIESSESESEEEEVEEEEGAVQESGKGKDNEQVASGDSDSDESVIL